MKGSKTRPRRRAKAATVETPAALEQNPAINVLHRVKQRWAALPTLRRHWFINIALGILIEVTVHIAGHGFHFSPVVNFQNWGLDVVTRLSHAACTWADSSDARQDKLSHLLRCPDAAPATRPPLLVAVDAETWRSPIWGGGEPVRAPRDAMATLIERSFELGAQQVVLDILIEDGASRGAARPAADSITALTAQGDQLFANRLRALLAQPALDGSRKLILVRTERQPLPDDMGAYLGEIRHSAALDTLAADSGGRIVIAAPYFQVDLDRVTRDWNLFKVVCERKPSAAGDPDTGRLRVVPSVQLITAAHRQAQLNGDEQALAAIQTLGSPGSTRPTPSCTPFPREGDGTPGPIELTVKRCEVAAVIGGVQALSTDRDCKAATLACNRSSKQSEATTSLIQVACNAHASRLCAARSASYAAKGLSGRLESGYGTQGVNRAYWSEVQSAFRAAKSATAGATVELADLPPAGGLGNRVVFRHAPAAPDSQGPATSMSARVLLDQTGQQPPGLAELFSNRIVVIGQTHDESGDFFSTPLGRMPGAQLLVNAIDSMAKQGLMRQPRWQLTMALAVALIVAVGYVFARWSSTMGKFLATGAVIMTAGVASVFYFAHGVWLDFAAPIIGIQIHGWWAAFEERQRLASLATQHDRHH